MKIPRSSTLSLLGTALFLVVFAYLLLTYTRRVESTSMLPTLEPGDLVVVQKVGIGDLKVGDIIVYDPPCSLGGISVIHRVVGYNATGLPITKGDNNGYTDVAGGIARAGIEQKCLVGKVIYVIPYVELIALLPGGTNYIIAALILIALFYWELRGGEEEPEKEERKDEGKLLPGITERSG